MFKKVYLEITNACNLKCSFCIQNKRKIMFMKTDEFKIILKTLRGHTKYLYFHILGEPLLHPDIDEFINLASKEYFVNITTNGYLIKNIENNKNIRQLNISLHSFSEHYNKSLDEYMSDLFEVVDKLKKYTYISYRLWVDSKYKKNIIAILEKKYGKTINSSQKLEKNVFINFADSFLWPDLNNNLNNNNGKCYGLINHFGILVDGTIIPCCLDSRGVINLGNIFSDNLDDVFKQARVQNMIKEFKNNKRCEELCKHCGFFINKKSV